MTDKNLLNKVQKLGYPLFEAEESVNVSVTLCEVALSKDLRLWEGFSVMLANSAEKSLFDYGIVKECLKERSDNLLFDSLVALSLALYKVLKLKFSWSDKLYKTLKDDTKKEVDRFLKNLKNNKDFTLRGLEMSSQRLKTAFNNYYNTKNSKLDGLLLAKNELNLEYALSQVFSPKQKELFLKKLKGEKLTKTEKEYFSRVVKKKVLALANKELHNLSQQLLD